MAEETRALLTEDAWLSFERLNDALYGTSDLPEALKKGLDILLQALGRPGAALYLPRFCEHIAQDWTFLNIPPAWEDQLTSDHSQLHGILRHAVTGPQPLAGVEALELAAVFPIPFPGAVGALLVYGDAVSPADYPLWRAFIRPIDRLVTLHAAISGNDNGTPGYRELMRSRNTLRTMFDSLPISIYIIDNAYNLLAVNHSRSSRVGEKPSWLVGRKCYESLYGRSGLCPGCRVVETFGTALNTTRVSRTWLDHEKFIEWEISTFPILDEKDLVVQTIVIEQDMTDKRNLEANLIQSEKLAAVGQLAAGVAHEINNPLTAIIANAQLLRREIPPGEDDLLDSVKLIEMAGTRASQVVRNLLGIARKEKYEFEPIDLNETIHNALTLVQHELVGRPIQVQMGLNEELPLVVASQDQLQGVWINLILNAIDAVDKEEGHISITSRHTGSEFQVAITDNGKGIAPDHLPRVFEPFFTTKSPGRGTGLGLSVCQRVIRQHGGNIQVESQLGKWTKFTVCLPGSI